MKAQLTPQERKLVDKYLEVKEKKEKELQSLTPATQPEKYVNVRRQQLDLLNKRILSKLPETNYDNYKLNLEDIPKVNKEEKFKTHMLLEL